MNKGLEALKNFREHYIFELDEEENLNIIEKELKALKIIKEKRVDVALFLRAVRFNNVGTYNFEIVALDRHLTQEEYDLLKEVLL